MFRYIEMLHLYLIKIIFGRFYYDKKYLKSKFFMNKYKGFGAIGNRWLYNDIKSRFFTGKNRGCRFPISSNCTIIYPSNILFDPNTLNNFQMNGSYYQASKDTKIIIGTNTWISQNVGIITVNHDTNNPELRGKMGDVIIGNNCWIGMNSIILPGVVLGDNVVVGAGSVVTKSVESFTIIAGNPARILRKTENKL